MFLSHLLINAKAAAGVANEAIGVVGQINAVKSVSITSM